MFNHPIYKNHYVYHYHKRAYNILRRQE